GQHYGRDRQRTVGAAQSRGRSSKVVVGQEPSEASGCAAGRGAQHAGDLGSDEGDSVGAEPHLRIQGTGLDVALEPVSMLQYSLAEQERLLAGAGAGESCAQARIEVDYAVLVHVIDAGESAGGSHAAGRNVFWCCSLEDGVVGQVWVLEQVVCHIDP